MLKKIAGSMLVALALLINLNVKVKADEKSYNTVMKQDILCLMIAYPEAIISVEINEKGYVYIKMKSGNKILYDDKKIKTSEERLNNPDLQDTMEQLYPLSFPEGLMPNNFDPGRCRSYGLLKQVYGSTAADIQKRLKNVKVGYGNLQFNSSNNAAAELAAVMKELVPLANRRADIRAILFPTSGTFNYRYISGTNRLSPHAFGMAIDLASNKNDYWKWANSKEGEKRLLSYPKDLVEAFEKHNFIWGGKWNHFDTLHFEYRPEIILKARYFGNSREGAKLWYDGAAIENLQVEAKIKEINNIIK